MEKNKILLGKRVLVVDDEKDILDTLIDLLRPCKIDTASSFDEGRRLLERYRYDVAVLDILGVNGFELLDVARGRGIPAIMLTANALSEESLGRSIESGAAYFVPKEELPRIHIYVADVLEAIEKKKNPWVRWFRRLGNIFDATFTGPGWRERQKEFLEKLERSEWW